MSEIIRLDNRGLEPPEPMLKILEATAKLEPGQILVAHNDRQPMFLFPKLDERGLKYEVIELTDGSFEITIRKE